MHLSTFFHHIRLAAEQSDSHVPAILRICRDVRIESIVLDRGDATDDTLAMLSDAGIDVECVPTWVNFFDGSFDPSDTRFLDLPRKAGAKSVLLLPHYFPEGSDRGALLPSVADGLRAMVAHCRDAGIAPSIENFDNLQSPLCRTDDVVAILDAVPGLEMNFDTGNCAINDEPPLPLLERTAPRITSVHAKDRARAQFAGGKTITTASGTPLYACPVGAGFIPFPEILSRLRDIRFDGPVIAEFYGVDAYLPSLVASANYLAALFQ